MSVKREETRTNNARRRKQRIKDHRRLKGMTLAELKAEINRSAEHSLQSSRTGIKYALRAGEGLLEVKSRKSHGGWEEWLRRHFNASPETARVYMRIAKNRWYVEETILENPHVSLEEIRKAISKPNPAKRGTAAAIIREGMVAWAHRQQQEVDVRAEAETARQQIFTEVADHLKGWRNDDLVYLKEHYVDLLALLHDLRLKNAPLADVIPTAKRLPIAEQIPFVVESFRRSYARLNDWQKERLRNDMEVLRLMRKAARKQGLEMERYVDPGEGAILRKLHEEKLES